MKLERYNKVRISRVCENEDYVKMCLSRNGEVVKMLVCYRKRNTEMLIGYQNVTEY